MAIMFFNGTSHKDMAPIPQSIMKKAIEAAKSYDWTYDEEEIYKIEKSDVSYEKAQENEYPKKCACRKTGLIASKMYENSPVFFVNGELLLQTADEKMVQDIIT